LKIQPICAACRLTVAVRPAFEIEDGDLERGRCRTRCMTALFKLTPHRLEAAPGLVLRSQAMRNPRRQPGDPDLIEAVAEPCSQLSDPAQPAGLLEPGKRCPLFTYAISVRN
jgi:hypothetical protein